MHIIYNSEVVLCTCTFYARGISAIDAYSEQSGLANLRRARLEVWLVGRSDLKACLK